MNCVLVRSGDILMQQIDLRSATRRAAHRMCAVFRRDKDVSSKNPDHVTDGRFALDLNVFFGDFLCAKESYPRVSAEALLSAKEAGFPLAQE